MQNLQSATIQCPYCGEEIEVLIDCSIRSQEYVEDCSVCCRPIAISVESSHGEVLSIEGRTEDE
ncbi:MAG: CPXCG motif-containing cysteine-rich protein [Methylomonas sp.]